MNEKICKECEESLSIDNFYKNKNYKDGYFSKCKVCIGKKNKENKEKRKKYNQKHYVKNKNKIKKKNKTYYNENKEKVKKINKIYYNENKDEINKRNIKYQKNNKDIIKKIVKKYQNENKDKISKYMKGYKKENKNKIKQYNKEYQKENRNKINKYYKEKYNNDDEYKLYCLVRNRLNTYLKSKNIDKNDNSTHDSIGLEPKVFNKWIQFNLGIDGLKDKEYHDNWEDIIKSKCNHWTNIIPTTPEYNLEKSDREPTKHELFKQELRIYLFTKHFIE
jgi:hypothetical protein